MAADTILKKIILLFTYDVKLFLSMNWWKEIKLHIKRINTSKVITIWVKNKMAADAILNKKIAQLLNSQGSIWRNMLPYVKYYS